MHLYCVEYVVVVVHVFLRFMGGGKVRKTFMFDTICTPYLQVIQINVLKYIYAFTSCSALKNRRIARGFHSILD